MSCQKMPQNTLLSLPSAPDAKRPRVSLLPSISFLVIMAFILSVIGSSNAPGEEQRIRKLEHVTMGVISLQTINSLPLELGIKEGFYKGEGVDLETLWFRGGQMSIIGVSRGQLDYALPASTAIRAAAAGIKVKLFLITSKLPYALWSVPSIKTIKDLKGKVVGVSTLGDSPDYGLRAILKHHGLNPDRDLMVRGVGGGRMGLAAMISGAVDGAMIVGSEIVEAKRKGFTFLAAVSDVTAIPSLGVVTSHKKLKDNRDQIKRMIRATLKAMVYVKDHKKEAIEFILKEWKIDREAATFLYDSGVKDYTKDGTMEEEAILNEVKLLKDRGGLDPKAEVPLSQLVDFSILEEVKRELGIG